MHNTPYLQLAQLGYDFKTQCYLALMLSYHSTYKWDRRLFEGGFCIRKDDKQACNHEHELSDMGFKSGKSREASYAHFISHTVYYKQTCVVRGSSKVYSCPGVY